MVSKKVAAIAVIVLVIVTFVYLEQGFRNEEPSKNAIFGKENPYVKEYALPADSAPNGLIVDKGGIVWVASKNGILFSLDPKTGQINGHEIKSGAVQYGNLYANSTMVWTVIQGGDGKIWFSPLGTRSIWEFDPTSGNFDSLPVHGSPFQMEVGENKEIWFTTLSGNTIGVVEKSQGHDYKISSFDTQNNTIPAGIFLQNDSVWISGIGSQNILQYKINRENDSVKNISMIQSIPKDNSTLFSSPTDVLVNKNIVWLTEHGTSFLTSYDLDNDKITRYPTSQNYFHTTTLPFWIRGSEDPKVLWFNEHQGNKIGCFDIYNKTLTEYSIPSLPKDGYLTYSLNISQDPKDEKILWFSEWNTDKVAVINGHIPIPFEINSNTKKITLDSSKTDDVVDLEIHSMHQSGVVSLNASSSITSTAELGNLTARFSSNIADLSHYSKIQLFLHNGGVPPGNYTVGISASDGFVTKTEFLNLSILNS